MPSNLPRIPALALLAGFALAAAAAVRQPGTAPAPTPAPNPTPAPATPGDGDPPVLPPGFPAELRLLGELAGTFSARVLVFAGEDKPATEAMGTSTRRAILGGRFVRDTLEVTQGPTPFTLELTFGYNPDARPDERFEVLRLSSAAFSMMPERGKFDPSTKIFTFSGEHLTDGKRARTRTVFRLEAYTTHVLEVYVTLEDPSDPKKILTPEFKAYTVEYERLR